ncbi:hypothetical protein PFLUV_G00132830 [Perca fluviatilis]|uniref:Uncharacterized protein n=1 Tax=Perca fluviatilis TaxID=8168 RepID=A0A6A5EYS5_PERFL|nr:hypothetical protein PFLUV_G00132830 [Perca fluviatilis]
MLLLILFAGCLATCAAQTTPTPVSLTQSVQATSVVAPGLNADAVAFLRAAVTSDYELNETTIGPALLQLKTLIQHLQPGVDFMVTVKNITRV